MSVIEREREENKNTFPIFGWVLAGEKKDLGSEFEIENSRSTLVFPSDSAEMVARTPPKSKKMLAALNPLLIRETLNKVTYTFPHEIQYSDCRSQSQQT